MVTKLTQSAVERIQDEIAKLNEQGSAMAFETERLAALVREEEDERAIVSATAKIQVIRNRLRKLDAQIAEAVAAAGFGQDQRSLPVPPAINNTPIVAQDLLQRFESDLVRLGLIDPPDRSREALGSAPGAMSKSGAIGSGPSVPNGFAISDKSHVGAPRPRLERMPPHLPPRPRAKKRPPIRETAAEGERLVMIVKGTVAHPRGGADVQSGDVIALTHKEALPIVRNGAADFTTPEEIAAMDIATGRTTLAAAVGSAA